jgi:hypothetical protein
VITSRCQCTHSALVRMDVVAVVDVWTMIVARAKLLVADKALVKAARHACGSKHYLVEVSELGNILRRQRNILERLEHGLDFLEVLSFGGVRTRRLCTRCGIEVLLVEEKQPQDADDKNCTTGSAHCNADSDTARHFGARPGADSCDDAFGNGYGSCPTAQGRRCLRRWIRQLPNRQGRPQRYRRLGLQTGPASGASPATCADLRAAEARELGTSS